MDLASELQERYGKAGDAVEKKGRLRWSSWGLLVSSFL